MAWTGSPPCLPPTLALTNQAFGKDKALVTFGWILAAHQVGAACAAFLAGWSRGVGGSYLEAFIIAGFTGVAAALMALAIGRRGQLNAVQAA